MLGKLRILIYLQDACLKHILREKNTALECVQDDSHDNVLNFNLAEHIVKGEAEWTQCKEKCMSLVLWRVASNNVKTD